MMPMAVQATLIATIAVVGIAVVAFLAARWARSSRDLGTAAGRATFEALHTASLAAPHLRRGLAPEGAAKAARHLRGLLGCETLVVTDTAQVLATDGVPLSPAPSGPMELAAAALAARHTVVRRLQPGHAVFAPIVVQGRAAGTVGAYTTGADAAQVRAVTEVAAWVAAQVGLAELDESRTQLAEAEVRALRAQISPHFIYNSLNAIASFINTDPQRARNLVVEFADFTRYTFRRHGDFTTLAEELQAIDRYLLLEKARFGDRIRVRLQIAPEVLGTQIPFLSLQPLVENAVRHGLESKAGGGLVTIAAHDSGNYAEITVEDDGVGMDPETLRSVLAGTTEGLHVGLRNVDVRLRQVYGEGHGLVVDTAPGAGTLITLRVPKTRPEHDGERPGPAPEARRLAGS
ncbi:histidine kinase [Arthrobacter ginkgonis]|uniref:Histidine kinase n=1 Tax=Arthrobacter ginkgonis TaxID=1630594 RepID=A0ABP7CQ28_9MICC